MLLGQTERGLHLISSVPLVNLPHCSTVRAGGVTWGLKNLAYNQSYMQQYIYIYIMLVYAYFDLLLIPLQLLG